MVLYGNVIIEADWYKKYCSCKISRCLFRSRASLWEFVKARYSVCEDEPLTGILRSHIMKFQPHAVWNAK